MSESERYGQLQAEWNERGCLCEGDFLAAVLRYREMKIRDALASEDCIVRVLAILDRRVGERTLKQIRDSGEYRQLPEWVQQFYRLRFPCDREPSELSKRIK